MSKCIPGEQVFFDSSVLELLKLFDAPDIPPKPTWEVALKITFYIIAIVVGIVGNIIVILIILINRRLRSVTNILIFNLAISDLMVAFFCMWVHLGNQLTPMWPFGAFMCKFVTFVQVFSVTLSVLTLTSISFERFMAIVFPVKGKLSLRGIYLLIILSWLLSLGIASPQLFIRELVVMQFRNRDDIVCQERWTKYYTDTCGTVEPGRRIYYTVEAVVMYIVPAIVMVIAYTIIVGKLYCKRIHPSFSTALAANQDKTRRKVLRMLMAVVAVFIICWTPQQAFLLWDAYRSQSKAIPGYIYPLKYTALFLAYFNSAMNPVIYAGMNDNFRKGFNEAMHCRLFRQRTQVRPVTVGRTPQSENVYTIQNSSQNTSKNEE